MDGHNESRSLMMQSSDILTTTYKVMLGSVKEQLLPGSYTIYCDTAPMFWLLNALLLCYMCIFLNILYIERVLALHLKEESICICLILSSLTDL